VFPLDRPDRLDRTSENSIETSGPVTRRPSLIPTEQDHVRSDQTAWCVCGGEHAVTERERRFSELVENSATEFDRADTLDDCCWVVSSDRKKKKTRKKKKKKKRKCLYVYVPGRHIPDVRMNEESFGCLGGPPRRVRVRPLATTTPSLLLSFRSFSPSAPSLGRARGCSRGRRIKVRRCSHHPRRSLAPRCSPHAPLSHAPSVPHLLLSAVAFIT